MRCKDPSYSARFSSLLLLRQRSIFSHAWLAFLFWTTIKNNWLLQQLFVISTITDCNCKPKANKLLHQIPKAYDHDDFIQWQATITGVLVWPWHTRRRVRRQLVHGITANRHHHARTPVPLKTCVGINGESAFTSMQIFRSRFPARQLTLTLRPSAPYAVHAPPPSPSPHRLTSTPMLPYTHATTETTTHAG